MKTIAITGASGFIGRHLVTKLLKKGGTRIKVLSRSVHAQATRVIFPPEVEVFVGDLLDPISLYGFFESGCTVINLVYLRREGEAGNLASIDNLIDACNSARVSRLIHCSTVDVVGRTPDQRVVETSVCYPVTGYAITKLKVEGALLNAEQVCFDVTILRPTAVFGPGGENLKKLSKDLRHGNSLMNTLKACLFGRRRMNLVYIDNVTTAILFLVNYDCALRREIFIISDDDEPSNNFASIEMAIIKGLRLPNSVLRHIHFPALFLSIILRFIGKNNVNPNCNYDSAKLCSLGYRRPVPFEEGLTRYIAWYLSESLNSSEKRKS